MGERYVVEEVLRTGPEYNAVDDCCFRVKDTETDSRMPGQYESHAEAQAEADRLNAMHAG